MNRYFIELSYKGTAFSGFQKQQNSKSIQEEVEKCLETFYQEKIQSLTSSRTDAGVHAYQNYLHFDLEQEVLKKDIYNLNAILDKDIVIKNIRKVKADAHSRFDALGRKYIYRLHQQKNPFIRSQSYFYPYKLDFELLQFACERYKQETSFESFAKKHSDVHNFNCKIFSCDWKKLNDNEFAFSIHGNRFLRGMVRALVGTSLLLARGKISKEAFENIFNAKDNSLAEFSPEAKGLYLAEVLYPAEIFMD